MAFNILSTVKAALKDVHGAGKIESGLSNYWLARDLFHYAVRAALEKEKWVITDDPLKVGAGGAKFEIDLGAEPIRFG